MSNKTAVVVIQSDFLDWIQRHPEHFVSAIKSRIENDELDKYPGYARWNGDGISGVQVVWVSKPDDKNETCLISVGNGCGIKVLTAKTKNSSTKETKFEFLKALANKLGYVLKKKKETKNEKV